MVKPHKRSQEEIRSRYKKLADKLPDTFEYPDDIRHIMESLERKLSGENVIVPHIEIGLARILSKKGRSSGLSIKQVNKFMIKSLTIGITVPSTVDSVDGANKVCRNAVARLMMETQNLSNGVKTPLVKILLAKNIKSLIIELQETEKTNSGSVPKFIIANNEYIPPKRTYRKKKVPVTQVAEAMRA